MRTLKYVGIDDWNRPVFKNIKTGLCFGSTDKLFDWGAEESEILEEIKVTDLQYFGDNFNCEPEGGDHLDSSEYQIKTVEEIQQAQEENKK